MIANPAAATLSRVPDLDSLELLLQVAATGSFGRAAAAHGISQPAVSARIAGMETLVGFPLVQRTARGTCCTRPPGWPRASRRCAPTAMRGCGCPQA